MQATENAAPVYFLKPGTVVSFAGAKYQITGTDHCGISGSDCVAMEPGARKIVYLRSVESQEVMRGIVVISGESGQAHLNLAALIHEDGVVKKFSQPILGK
ncbi:hypothetical protein HK19_15410 [Acetobacter persici]|nr:hypothetical protein HK19_15410 [Acetobacter persici]